MFMIRYFSRVYEIICDHLAQDKKHIYIYIYIAVLFVFHGLPGSSNPISMCQPEVNQHRYDKPTCRSRPNGNPVDFQGFLYVY